MISNSTIIVDRELAAGRIEGLDFGTKLWVIARSPTAVLVWVYGHSASINGHRQYYGPHLTILPDRTHHFMSRPEYKSLYLGGGRLSDRNLAEVRQKIIDHFGNCYGEIERAVRERKTAIIDGGGGKLLPPKLWGAHYRDFINNPDNGFLHRDEVNKGLRYKLGYKGEKV